MADQVIGTAKLDVTVDTSTFEARVSSMRSITAGFGQEAQEAFTKATAGVKTASSSLLKYVQQLGMGTDEQKLLNAAIRGVPIQILEEARQKMLAHKNATEDAAKAAKKLADEERQAAAVAAEMRRVQGQRDEFIKSLQSQALATTRTKAEMLELRAAELGVASAAAPFIAQLKAQEQAQRILNGQTAQGTKEFNAYGLSLKQQQAAMRGVPAQITDIFVSLQGGQAPLTVLLQQGGQLKDMFGGIRPAIAALGAGLMSVINPLTLTAAAVIALSVAAYQGSQESTKYGVALAKTGNIAATTTGQMELMSQQLAGSVVLQSKAAEALTAVANTGKFAGTQFMMVAEAAVRMESASVQAIDKTVDQFASLAQDPVNAVAKLNQETHFLTNEIFQQIKALEEQGRTQDAATLAMQAYADAVRQRTEEVKQNLGILEQAWRALGLGAKWAWDQMMDIGREGSRADQINEAMRNIQAHQAAAAAGNDFAQAFIETQRERIRKLQDDYVNEQKAANRRAAQQEADDYAIQQDRNISAHKSADEKRAAEIARSRKEAGYKAARAMIAGDKELAAQIQANQQKYEAALIAEGSKKRSGGGAARSLANAQQREELQDFRDILTQEQGLLRNQTQIVQAEYGAKLISLETYYAKIKQLTEQDTAAQEKALRSQIEVLRNRNATGKDAVDVQRQLGQLEAQLSKIRADGATQLQVLTIQEEEAVRRRRLAIDGYKQSLEQSNESLRRQFDAQIAAITMGEREAEMQRRIADIYAEVAEKRRQLAREFAENNDKEAYDEKLRALEEYMQKQVDTVKRGYDQMKQAESNWLNGLQTGVQNWLDQTSKVSTQVQTITGNALDGAADAMTRYFTTGKSGWRDYLKDIGTQIVKFMAKQVIMQFVKYILQAWGGGGTTTTGTTTGVEAFNYGGFAKGASFTGSHGLSQYSGKIVNSPTPFYFAKGAGVMGEAGPEAIMPLTRGSDGKLGVKSVGGAGEVNLYLSLTVNSDGSKKTETSGGGGSEQEGMYRQFMQQMANVADERLQKAMLPNGLLWKAGVTQR